MIYFIKYNNDVAQMRSAVEFCRAQTSNGWRSHHSLRYCGCQTPSPVLDVLWSSQWPSVDYLPLAGRKSWPLDFPLGLNVDWFCKSPRLGRSDVSKASPSAHLPRKIKIPALNKLWPRNDYALHKSKVIFKGIPTYSESNIRILNRSEMPNE